MKINPFKTVLVSATILLLAFACQKRDTCPAPQHPKDNNDGGNNNPGYCNAIVKGTIERCPNDSSLWFINVITGSQCPTTGMTTSQLVPVNLPAAFKVNAQRVGFSYTPLGDSVELNCWRCGTPPIPKGVKVHICSIWQDTLQIIAMKPVIYLYPQKETKVNVELNFQGRLTVTYPEYSEKLHGWEVIAQKDGSLKNLSDNTEHQYLFWEGAPAVPYNLDMKEGFCVKGSDTRVFLQKMLPKLGLTPKEYNDMIVFWLPKMVTNNYNIIHFAGNEYSKSAPLNITPKPDNVLRVFMAYLPSDHFVKTREPVILTPKRSGFTVVEWGGTELTNTYANVISLL
jgi:hypothetical protein